MGKLNCVTVWSHIDLQTCNRNLFSGAPCRQKGEESQRLWPWSDIQSSVVPYVPPRQFFIPSMPEHTKLLQPPSNCLDKALAGSTCCEHKATG